MQQNGVNLEVIDRDNISVNVSGNKMAAGTIIKVIAIVLCLLFFLPMFTVSCGNMTISISGLDSTIGKTVSSFGMNERIPGNFLTIFLLLIPASLFCVFHFRRSLAFAQGNLFALSMGVSGSGFLALIIFVMSVNARISAEGEAFLDVKFTFWYYLSLILYVISCTISYMCFRSAKKAIL